MTNCVLSSLVSRECKHMFLGSWSFIDPGHMAQEFSTESTETKLTRMRRRGYVYLDSTED